MTGFIVMSLISLLVIAVTCLITYEVLGYVWNLLPRLTISPRLRVLVIILPIFMIHIANIWFYAVVYFLVENYTPFGTLTGSIHPIATSYESLVDRLYYSVSVYTSLGFGDILPSRDLRMLSSAEVLDGLVLIGWTISFTYLTMEKFWSLSHHLKHKKD